MTLRRDRKRGQKTFRRSEKGLKIASMARAMCPNGCGGPGPHFVPPSFGDSGFFICTPKTD